MSAIEECHWVASAAQRGSKGSETSASEWQRARRRDPLAWLVPRPLQRRDLRRELRRSPPMRKIDMYFV